MHPRLQQSGQALFAVAPDHGLADDDNRHPASAKLAVRAPGGLVALDVVLQVGRAKNSRAAVSCPALPRAVSEQDDRRQRQRGDDPPARAAYRFEVHCSGHADVRSSRMREALHLAVGHAA